jgi:hypothetical protein
MTAKELKIKMGEIGGCGVIVQKKRSRKITIYTDDPPALYAALGHTIEADRINVQFFEIEHPFCVTQADYDRVTKLFESDSDFEKPISY